MSSSAFPSLKERLKMSSMNLATKAMYRRMEVDERVSVLEGKCQVAIHNIAKLRRQAKLFVEDIANQKAADLKDVYLHSMKELDEYIYVVTEFNLFVETLAITLDDNNSSIESPIKLDLDELVKSSKNPDSLLDAVSEPLSSYNQVVNNAPPKAVKKPKDGCLISFSSCSASAESLSYSHSMQTMPETTAQSPELIQEIAQEFDQIDLAKELLPATELTLPAQTVLNIDSEHAGFIIHVELPAIWIILGDLEDLHELKTKMNTYYRHFNKIVNLDDKHLNYWAMFDTETDHWYRVLLLNQFAGGIAQVFLVDTGEEKDVRQECLKYLAPEFYNYPPFARCCHLAEFDLDEEPKEVVDKITKMVKNYLGCYCTLKVEDNNSESFAVTIKTEDALILNDEIINSGIIKPIPGSRRDVRVTASTSRGPITEDIDISDCPEHDDALVAVTGYHNRDEADICKFYRPGQKTCWKKHCKKKHIAIHPDGWTLDKVPCIAGLPPMPLPKPGDWKKVKVTSVPHFDRVYVQFISEEKRDISKRPFGVALPPATLADLITDMNSPCISYETCSIEPAIGEMVVVKYQDQLWYRARVVNVARSHKCVEVLYVDYGTLCWVRESDIRSFPRAFGALPAQAVRARLAGVKSRPRTSAEQLVGAQNLLQKLVMDKEVEARIISRSYDEIEVVLADKGYSIGDELAVRSDCVDLEPFQLEDDSNTPCKLIVP